MTEPAITPELVSKHKLTSEEYAKGTGISKNTRGKNLLELAVTTSIPSLIKFQSQQNGILDPAGFS